MLDKRIIEVDDDEAEKIIAASRHKELAGTLKGIATLLSKPEKDDKAIIDAIKKQGDSLDKVAAAIQNQPKAEKPEVKVELDNKEILPLLKDLKEGNDKIIEALNNRAVVEKFDFEYDQFGKVITAKVNYKK